MFSPAGRRLFPPIRLSAPAVALSSDESATRLAVLSTDGRLRVWDVQRAASLIDTSAAPVLAETRGNEGGCMARGQLVSEDL